MFFNTQHIDSVMRNYLITSSNVRDNMICCIVTSLVHYSTKTAAKYVAWGLLHEMYKLLEYNLREGDYYLCLILFASRVIVICLLSRIV